MNYDGGDIEEFELSVVNDGRVRLYNVNSETEYDFVGRAFLQFLKGEKGKPALRNSDRKRTKIERRTKIRRSLK